MTTAKTLHDYYCSEHTLDVKIPGAQRTVRVWLDAKNPGWTPTAMATLARGLRTNHKSGTRPAQIVDVITGLSGVNAVQVIDYIEAGGYSVGIVAYTQRFDPDGVLVMKLRAEWKLLRAWWTKHWNRGKQAALKFRGKK